MKKIALTILSSVFIMTSLVYAADKGKVAVAAEGKTTAAKVSGVAARSPYFLIFDETGKLLEAADNSYKAAKGGAGTSGVPFLAQKGVTFVVAGEFGENMIRALKSKGIGYLEFKGSAEEALKKVLEANKQNWYQFSCLKMKEAVSYPKKLRHSCGSRNPVFLTTISGFPFSRE